MCALATPFGTPGKPQQPHHQQAAAPPQRQHGGSAVDTAIDRQHMAAAAAGAAVAAAACIPGAWPQRSACCRWQWAGRAARGTAWGWAPAACNGIGTAAWGGMLQSGLACVLHGRSCGVYMPGHARSWRQRKGGSPGNASRRRHAGGAKPCISAQATRERAATHPHALPDAARQEHQAHAAVRDGGAIALRHKRRW